MKYYFLLFALLCSCSLLNAQVQKLTTHQFEGHYQLDLIQDELDQQTQKKIPEINNQLREVVLAMEQNELMIHYQLEDPGDQGYYLITVEIKIDDQLYEFDPAYLLGDWGRMSRAAVEGNKTIIWTNLIAQLPDHKSNLQLTLKAERWGIQKLPYGVNCDQRPVFEFKQKLPFYALTAGGVGALVGGMVIRNNARDHLRQHRESVTLSERSSQYQKYTDQLKAAKIVSYVGIGILAVDALFYVLRKGKHEKQLEVFEEKCTQESLSVNPYWEPAYQGQPQQLGLHFSYQF